MQSPPIALMFPFISAGFGWRNSVPPATRRRGRVRGAADQAGFLAVANVGEADAAVGRYGEAGPGSVYTCLAALASRPRRRLEDLQKPFRRLLPACPGVLGWFRALAASTYIR